MRKTILTIMLLALAALATPRHAAADFALHVGQPGFSLYVGPPAVYGPPVAVAPPPVVYAPPPVVYAPPAVVVAPPVVVQWPVVVKPHHVYPVYAHRPVVYPRW